VGAILEIVYYRYLYFQEEGGRVLYALSTTAPHLMFPRLLKVCLGKKEDVEAVWGTYVVQKDSISIVARQAWTTVKFELTIQRITPFGRFGMLTVDRHLTSASGCFEDWSKDLVDYKVPSEQFHFIKHDRL
jgi:hypothetical protein